MTTFSSSPNFSNGFPTPGPQDPTPQKVMDHIFFLSETDWKIAREQEHFDYIIIGSGFCSLAFAERILAEKPKSKILILERGPFFLPEHFQNLAIPYQHTLGGLSETFPWTLSSKTATQPAGNIQFQHGMVPFFGGRSIMWSAWCPRPTQEEMQYWPQEVIDAARAHFESAEKLLNVVPADQIDNDLSSELLSHVAKQRPVYSVMQHALQEMLAANLNKVSSATRSMAAPLAAGAGTQEGLDFAKFSTPSVMLDLSIKQSDLYAKGLGSPLKMAGNCIVNRIHQQDGVATALDTSRGVVNVGDAKVILAMGTLPPATLIMNSFPQVKKAGERFTAHFITSVVARIPRKDYDFADQLDELELAAIYMAGVNAQSGMQYHVQLSVLSDKNPMKNAQKAARYMPDVVATASIAQLTSSEDYLVFVCAVLGEMDFRNSENNLRLNGQLDPTTNVTLQALASETDLQTWDTMDEGTFQMLENALSPQGSSRVEYWHGNPNEGVWSAEHPAIAQRRVGGLVHEGSSLYIGKNDEGVVGLDYRPNGVENVYVTGGALWPASGSWNPTMTMVALAQDLADNFLNETESKTQAYSDTLIASN
ncbi:GMC oxidoreductase [Flavobacterium sp. GT3R68]|uniref:GMC oxidoreductase n=1 Tax=Flavobacterium sp. GT3R68 TaxID=2594437 RepID=UPI000F880419|nr:GMC oxidoreductase [Flavobacterium sp. GT3R68]RTY88510.1 GMC family oxidoreductase [Flavobacterium sp. GSN2]TRW92610.1 GMC family oxidoreductase [Flavobacterium sp. GT3R68]